MLVRFKGNSGSVNTGISQQVGMQQVIDFFFGQTVINPRIGGSIMGHLREDAEMIIQSSGITLGKPGGLVYALLD